MASPHTDGFVGTIEAETRDVDRIWFSLTGHADRDDWVRIAQARAWFTMNLQTSERASHLAQLDLLLASMRDGLMVRVSHGGALPFGRDNIHDSFEVDGVRVLRAGLAFG